MDHDLIIIGGGAGGLSAARAARWQGADVALISEGPLGGDCTFTGCVPSKTLIAAAKDRLSFGDAITESPTLSNVWRLARHLMYCVLAG